MKEKAEYDEMTALIVTFEERLHLRWDGFDYDANGESIFRFRTEHAIEHTRPYTMTLQGLRDFYHQVTWKD